MTQLTVKTNISDTYPNPSNAVARAGFGNLWDVVNETTQAAEAVLASAATINIGGQTSTKLQVTGTTTVTSLGTTYRGPIAVRFSGALTLTHNATTLLLPNGLDVQTLAGDTCMFVPKSTAGTLDGWVCVGYPNTWGYTPTSTLTTAGTSPAYTLTTSLGALAAGQRIHLKFHTSGGISNTLNRDATGVKSLLQYDAAGAKVASSISTGMLADVEYDGTDYVVIDQLPTTIGFSGSLFGCIMSTAGSSTTMTISSGKAQDSTGLVTMSLAASTAKTTSAWVVGTAVGGLDTGTIANSTSYHFYIIRRPDTGVVDVLFSLSATAPTLPTNYTQFRRIGSIKTNGSGQWVHFVQRGDKFQFVAPTEDINSDVFTSTTTLYTTGVPTGVVLEGDFVLYKLQGGSGMVNFWDPALGSGVGAATSGAPWGKGYTDGAAGATINNFSTFTNTSAQIYGKATNGGQFVRLACNGWTDTRGRLE